MTDELERIQWLDDIHEGLHSLRELTRNLMYEARIMNESGNEKMAKKPHGLAEDAETAIEKIDVGLRTRISEDIVNSHSATSELINAIFSVTPKQ